MAGILCVLMCGRNAKPCSSQYPCMVAILRQTASRSTTRTGVSRSSIMVVSVMATPSRSSPPDVDDHRLDHRELLERVLAANAPDAALRSGRTAEWQVHLPIVRGIVHDHVANAEPLCDGKGPRYVAGEDGTGEPPAADRRKLGRLMLAVEGSDRRDRAEGFLGEDAHRGSDLGQHGRLEVPGRWEATDRPAIAEHAGSLRDRILDVFLDLLSRLIKVQRTDRCFLVKGA